MKVLVLSLRRAHLVRSDEVWKCVFPLMAEAISRDFSSNLQNLPGSTGRPCFSKGLKTFPKGANLVS